jgi:ABC-type bacteriocin/lantibiotic exporter with double-glycine peptidase domain
VSDERSAAAPASRPGLLAPEVVQTSSMDCGPAVLKCFAAGYGVQLDYGRLREACQTDLDGTSIDTLENIARRLGLDVEQVLLPADHLLVPRVHVLPAIIVTRQRDGTPHFVVAWRRVGPLLQVMDPATGRRWPTAARFLGELYLHRTEVAAPAWRRWADGEEYRAGLAHRFAALGVPAARAHAQVAAALADPAWRPIAALDAAVRMAQTLVSVRALRRGDAASRLVESVWGSGAGEPHGLAIPATYWPAVPAPGASDAAILLVRGAVVLRLRATAEATVGEAPAPAAREALPPELAAARATSPGPGRALLARVRAAGPRAVGVLALAVALASGTVVLEALVLRGVLRAGAWLAPHERGVYLGGVVAFFAALALLELPIALGLAWLGRQLEFGLRVAFHAKLPRLGSRYFRSRPVSDMSERAHSLQVLRQLPGLGANVLRASLQVAFTAGALIWLFPAGAPLVVLAATVALALPLAGQRVLAERELRVRSHLGALGRFYLDALLGLVPVRTHGAEHAVRREHATLLERWRRAGLRFQRALVATQAAQGLLTLLPTIALLWRYHAGGGDPAGLLLTAYWALALPALGAEVARLLAQAPLHRNVALRALEPLGALDEEHFLHASGTAHGARASAPGAALAWRGVSVRLGRRHVLRGIELNVNAGEHVAIVGASGAGKSTLIGTLLGWNRSEAGAIEVDGVPLDAANVCRLRAESAWVDAAVRIWNRPVRENVLYGAPGESARLPWAVEQADLGAVVAALPGGLDTALGEAGGLVSGGEGQRVRFARALLRSGVRLALLDEPFRGLERTQRTALLERARAHWARATLLCVTHDLEETLGFARVLVVEDGRIVEDGAPGTLAVAPGSRYRALLEGERALRARLWDGPAWRRLAVEDGHVRAGAR